jgi:hypothetical protein
MSVSLVVRDHAGREYPVDGPISIGRSSSNSIPIQEPLASRVHSTIFPFQNTIRIRDEQSTNGTFVNGARIMGEHPLAAGDQIQIGHTIFTVMPAHARKNSQQTLQANPYENAASTGGACPHCHRSTSVRSAANAPLAAPVQPSDTLAKVFTIFAALFSITGALLVIVTMAPLLLGGSLLGSFGGYGSSIYSGAMFLGFLAALIAMAPVVLLLVVVPWMMRNYLVRLYRQQLSDWQRADTKWQSLLYCSECAGVFLPGQTRLVPLEHMQPFLYEIVNQRVVMGISL